MQANQDINGPCYLVPMMSLRSPSVSFSIASEPPREFRRLVSIRINQLIEKIRTL